MNQMLLRYPALKVFSLPRSNQHRTTELGLKGESEQVSVAIKVLKTEVSALGFPWIDIV